MVAWRTNLTLLADGLRLATHRFSNGERCGRPSNTAEVTTTLIRQWVLMSASCSVHVFERCINATQMGCKLEVDGRGSLFDVRPPIPARAIASS